MLAESCIASRSGMLKRLQCPWKSLSREHWPYELAATPIRDRVIKIYLIPLNHGACISCKPLPLSLLLYAFLDHLSLLVFKIIHNIVDHTAAPKHHD